MNQHQGVHSPARNHSGSSDCLAKGSRGTQYAGVVVQHGRHCGLLIEAQHSCKSHIDGITTEALFNKITSDTIVLQ